MYYPRKITVVSAKVKVTDTFKCNFFEKIGFFANKNVASCSEMCVCLIKTDNMPTESYMNGNDARTNAFLKIAV